MLYSLEDQFRRLGFPGKDPALPQLMLFVHNYPPILFIYKYPPLSIARYSFIRLSELEQCKVEKTCPWFYRTEFEHGFS